MSLQHLLKKRYNKLLKLDAKEKIKGKNVTVTNYHGFAYACLKREGHKAGISDLIQVFLKKKPGVGKYDLVVLDEYQDIDQEISEMLIYIKECNPGIQEQMICLRLRYRIKINFWIVWQKQLLRIN